MYICVCIEFVDEFFTFLRDSAAIETEIRHVFHPGGVGFGDFCFLQELFDHVECEQTLAEEQHAVTQENCLLEQAKENFHLGGVTQLVRGVSLEEFHCPIVWNGIIFEFGTLDFFFNLVSQFIVGGNRYGKSLVSFKFP